MSTNPKLNPKNLAIKKKLHCRLGLTKKRYLPLTQKPVESNNRNAAWSVPTAILSTLGTGQDVRSDVLLIKIQKSNLKIRSLEKGHNSTSQRGDLFERQRNESYQLNSLALQYLSIALSHSSLCMTEHYVSMSDSVRRRTISAGSTHLEYLKKFHNYVKGLPPPEAIEEDDL